MYFRARKLDLKSIDKVRYPGTIVLIFLKNVLNNS